MSRRGAVLRPIDLARLAGISTQQVRNYVDAGILPPAPRTPTGYRRFDARHRRALLTYRALAMGYGSLTARAIRRAVHVGDLAGALALVDAGHAALHDQRLALQATSDALAAVAEEPPDSAAVPRSGLRIGEVAAALGLRPSALRVWEAAGLLTPKRDWRTGYRRYGANDVRDTLMIAMLRHGRYPLPQIRPIRAAIAQRQAELTRRATAMREGANHLHHYITVAVRP